MRSHRYSLIALALVLTLLAAACSKPGGAQQAGSPAPAPAAKPIKIGVVTSVTGALAGYADQEVKGLKLGIEYATKGTNQVLGRPIELIVEDDTGSPDVGKQKATKLLEQDKVDILQGTASTPVALAVAELAKQYGVVFMVDPAAGDQLTTTNFNKYIFRTGGNTSQDALTGGKAAVELLGKRIVHLAPDNAFGKSAQEAWDPIFKAAGGTVLKDLNIPLDAKDFATYLQQVRDLNPDVLMITWSGGSALKLFQQMNELGIYQKVKATTSIGDRGALEGMGDAGVGLRGVIRYFYTLPKTATNDWLVTEHKKRYTDAPDLFTAGGMASGIAIVRGIEKANAVEGDKLIAALEGMSFEGPKGTYAFRKEDHQALQPMYFVELVKDPNFKYPVPKLIKEYKPDETAPPVQVKK